MGAHFYYTGFNVLTRDPINDSNVPFLEAWPHCMKQRLKDCDGRFWKKKSKTNINKHTIMDLYIKLESSVPDCALRKGSEDPEMTNDLV